MNKENVLFAIVGVLLGFIIGFMFANSANQRWATPAANPAGAQPPNQALPPDHPPVGSNSTPGQMMPDVQAAIKTARDQPDNFDAQMKAAEAYYQIQRFEEAIGFLKRATELRPDSYEAIVNLGNANFDAGHYEEAEKWYTAALKKKPDDVSVRTDLGLTFFFRQPPDVERAIKEYRASLEREPNHTQTLQNLTVALIKKGSADEAKATLAKLEGINPNNPALGTLRADLAELEKK